MDAKPSSQVAIPPFYEIGRLKRRREVENSIDWIYGDAGSQQIAIAQTCRGAREILRKVRINGRHHQNQPENQIVDFFCLCFLYGVFPRDCKQIYPNLYFELCQVLMEKTLELKGSLRKAAFIGICTEMVNVHLLTKRYRTVIANKLDSDLIFMDSVHFESDKYGHTTRKTISIDISTDKLTGKSFHKICEVMQKSWNTPPHEKVQIIRDIIKDDDASVELAKAIFYFGNMHKRGNHGGPMWLVIAQVYSELCKSYDMDETIRWIDVLLSLEDRDRKVLTKDKRFYSEEREGVEWLYQLLDYKQSPAFHSYLRYAASPSLHRLICRVLRICKKHDPR